jgi:hypothetical protein
MKSIAFVLTFLATLMNSPGWAAEQTPFLLETKILLGDVRGRMSIGAQI